MRRVVITGIGIISSIGNNVEEVTTSLKEGKSGIVAAPDYMEHGFRSQIHGMPKINPADHIDKRNMRFMGNGAAYNFLAMEQAIADSGLEDSDVSNDRTGLVMGSGGPSTVNLFQAHKIVIEKGSPKRTRPALPRRSRSAA
jgi:3-oxoacyl-[acyl-carrier-protein] synthase-1